MISHIELRHIVETAFLPKKCVCTIEPPGSMTVQIFNEDSGTEELTVTGIDPSRLVSSRAIASLVVEIKEEAKIGHIRATARRRQV